MSGACPGSIDRPSMFGCHPKDPGFKSRPGRHLLIKSSLIILDAYMFNIKKIFIAPLLITVLLCLPRPVEANPIVIYDLPTASISVLAVRVLIFAAIEGTILALILSRKTRWPHTLSIGLASNLVSIPTTWYIFSGLVGGIGLYAVLVAELVPVFGEFLLIYTSTRLVGRMSIGGERLAALYLLGAVGVSNLITFFMGSFMYGAVSPF